MTETVEKVGDGGGVVCESLSLYLSKFPDRAPSLFANCYSRNIRDVVCSVDRSVNNNGGRGGRGPEVFYLSIAKFARS